MTPQPGCYNAVMRTPFDFSSIWARAVRLCLCLCLGAVFLSVAAWADPMVFPSQGRVGLGLNYPGVELKYFYTDSLALEARAQLDGEVWTAGLRHYFYLGALSGIYPFWGLEADYVGFKTDVAQGGGFSGLALAGGEYFFIRNLSAQLDFGPAYISLADAPTGVTAGGADFVLNFAINYYFGE